MASPDLDSLLGRLSHLRRYRDGGPAAPHKPLTVLYALAELQAGRRHISFRATETALVPLLQAHWPQIGHPRVEDPFVRLSTDEF